MGYLKKRIILKNETETLNEGMAVVTLEQGGNGVVGSVKVYNIKSDNDIYFGLSSNGKEVVNTKLLLNNKNEFVFKIDISVDINDNISCVIVKKLQNTVKPLVWGSNNKDATYKEDVVSMVSKKLFPQSNSVQFESIEVYTKSNDVNKVDETKQVGNIERSKETKLTPAEMFESSDEEIDEIIENEMEGDFYSLIKEQLDELFSKFPADEKLGNLIENSKWVRVDYENNGREYVVGLIYENNKVKYICYGVPSKFSNGVPAELEEFSQWLPLDDNIPEGDGFYLMFQDALTGESVSLMA